MHFGKSFNTEIEAIQFAKRHRLSWISKLVEGVGAQRVPVGFHVNWIIRE